MFKNRSGAIRWLFKNTKPVLGSIFLLTALGVIISFISVMFAMAARNLLDVATGVGTKSFGTCVAELLVLLVSEVALESFYNIYAVRVNSKNKNRLQKNLFCSKIHPKQ